MFNTLSMSPAICFLNKPLEKVCAQTVHLVCHACSQAFATFVSKTSRENPEGFTSGKGCLHFKIAINKKTKIHPRSVCIEVRPEG